MLDQLPAETLSLIFETFDPLDGVWPVIMRINHYVREVAIGARATIPIERARIVRMGEHVVDYFIDLHDKLRRKNNQPPIPGILQFISCANELSPRHFRMLMQVAGPADAPGEAAQMFTDLILRRPDLAAIAWIGRTGDTPCTCEARGDSAESHKKNCNRPQSDNIRRWFADCGGNLVYVNYRESAAAMEDYYNSSNLLAALTNIDPAVIRCYLVNCVGDDMQGQLVGLLFLSAVVDAAAAADGRPPRHRILGDEMLSLLMYYAALVGRRAIVDMINGLIAIDESGEMKTFFAACGVDTDQCFPRYSREWFEIPGAIEAVERYSSPKDNILAAAYSRNCVNNAPSGEFLDAIRTVITRIVESV